MGYELGYCFIEFAPRVLVFGFEPVFKGNPVANIRIWKRYLRVEGYFFGGKLNSKHLPSIHEAAQYMEMKWERASVNVEADMLDKVIAVLICVESGGDPAAVGDGGRSIGILQMSRAAVADYNRLTGRNWKWELARVPKHARHMARVLLLHYAGQPPADSAGGVAKRAYAEKCARIWNGGPSMRGTDAYAKKFLKEWDARKLTGQP